MSGSFEIIRDLAGDVNDANTDYTSPTPFVLGTARAIVNGALYPTSDEQWGYTELNDTTIRMANPPKSGFKMQLFYREQIAEGSPFHPAGTHP